MTALASLPVGVRRRFLAPAMTLVGWAYLATVIGLVAWFVLASSLTGWDPAVVADDSMRPSLSPGDVVLIGPRPEGNVGTGTVIGLETSPGRTEMRRVQRTLPDGSLVITARAGSGHREKTVGSASVSGVGRFVVPLVGTPVLWIRTGAYGQLVGLIAVTLADIALLLGPTFRRLLLPRAST